VDTKDFCDGVKRVAAMAVWSSEGGVRLTALATGGVGDRVDKADVLGDEEKWAEP